MSKQTVGPTDPHENTVGTDHLLVSGEVDASSHRNHDPLTHDTDDGPDSTTDKL